MITQRCTVLPLVGYYYFFYLIASFNIASASDKRFKDLEINTKQSNGRKGHGFESRFIYSFTQN